MNQNTRGAKLKPWVVISMISFVVLFIAVLAVALQLDPNKKSFQLKGKQVPSIGAQDLYSQKVFKIDSYKGSAMILNFWASWCESCKSEAHELEKFHRAFGRDIKVVGIAIQDELEAAKSFAQYYQKTYQLGMDTTGKINTEFGITGVPESFVVSKEGVVLEKIVGAMSYQELVSLKEKYKL